MAYLKKLPINDKITAIISEKQNPENSIYSELRIIDVGLLTCEVEKNSVMVVGRSCSDHGVCDHFSGKCVCDKYWMPNLYLFYLRNEEDLTSGNNCGKYDFRCFVFVISNAKGGLFKKNYFQL